MNVRGEHGAEDDGAAEGVADEGHLIKVVVDRGLMRDFLYTTYIQLFCAQDS